MPGRSPRRRRQLADALAATELVLAREQHLSQLDGLAAAAAHELGTPLSTITVIAKELQLAIKPGSEHADDVRLLNEQAKRCRDILAKLTELSSSGDPFDRMKLSALIEEVVAPHRNFGVAIEVALSPGDAAEPVGGRNPAILYGLGNLLENAVDFARERVEVAASWSGDDVAVTISDDGPGFAPEIMERIGEPYVTSRRRQPPDADGDTRRARGERARARLLHRQDAAGALGRHARFREPGVSGARRRGAGALGAQRFRATHRIRVLSATDRKFTMKTLCPLPDRHGEFITCDCRMAFLECMSFAGFLLIFAGSSARRCWRHDWPWPILRPYPAIARC